MTFWFAPLAAATALLTPAAPALAQAPPPSFVHAHRGAHTLDGAFASGEETMSAFRYAHLTLGSVIELDAKITRDNVPVVIHDATLERTTPCEGLVRDVTLAELARCPVDVLGAPGGSLGGAATTRTEPVATLAEALAFVRDAGATANLEIKNVPTDADFDSSDAFAETIMDAVVASGVPADRIILQSFWPPNLAVAQRRLPGAQTALLTLEQFNQAGPAMAEAAGNEWVSPAWPVDADYVQAAHAAGVKVVPYTLNTREDIVAAVAAGVDAVITDDALMARRALGIPDSDPEPGEGDVTGPVVEIRTPELVSHEFRSRTLRLRWRAEDPAGLGGYEAQLRRAGGSGWRPISLGGRPARRYVAHEGMTYDLRVRAQDNFGNLGDWAQKAFTVPLDERAKPIRLTRAWARVKRSGAWNAGVARTARAGAKASLDFTGSRVRVIGPLLPKGGRLQVRLDGARRVFSVRGRGERHVLFDSGVMAPGDHHLEIRSRGGGPVMLDAIAPS